MATKRSELKARLPTQLKIGRDIIYPVRELLVSIPNINRDLSEHPSLVAWYGVLKGKANANLKACSQACKERVEDLKREYKKLHPRCKEADATLYAQCDTKMRELWATRRALGVKREQMESCYEAAIQRSYTLQALAANIRQELGQRDNVLGQGD